MLPPEVNKLLSVRTYIIKIVEYKVLTSPQDWDLALNIFSKISYNLV